VPSPDARRNAHVRSLVRAAIATGIAAIEKPTTRAADYVGQTWDGDHVADLVLRAAVSPQAWWATRRSPKSASPSSRL